jgi:hypothetical protein
MVELLAKWLNEEVGLSKVRFLSLSLLQLCLFAIPLWNLNIFHRDCSY